MTALRALGYITLSSAIYMGCERIAAAIVGARGAQAAPEAAAHAAAKATREG